MMNNAVYMNIIYIVHVSNQYPEKFFTISFYKSKRDCHCVYSCQPETCLPLVSNLQERL